MPLPKPKTSPPQMRRKKRRISLPGVTKGCRTWRLGVPRTSTHWMGPNTTPTCDPWCDGLSMRCHSGVIHILGPGWDVTWTGRCARPRRGYRPPGARRRGENERMWGRTSGCKGGAKDTRKITEVKSIRNTNQASFQSKTP